MTSSFRVSDLRFGLALLLPAGLAFNMAVHPEHAAIGTFIVWAVVALVDQFWPGADSSPPPGGPSGFLLGILRLYVLVQVALLVIGLVLAQSSDWPVVLGLAYGVGFMTGAQGITFAHELGHSRSRFDRLLGWVLMASVNYSHFMVEHYRGHHVRAATHDDPASARYGESLWRFLPRTVWFSFVHAWELEARRIAEHRRNWITSPLLWASAIDLGIIVALLAAGWDKALVFWLAQSAFAVWLLESVNYIEHYGLERQVKANGQREPFGVAHAWNADHVLSNSLLANLQRHSDHHMHAWKPYPELEPLPGPQLPTGYAGCLLLASIPPLWFRLMHRRLQAMPQALPASA